MCVCVFVSVLTLRFPCIATAQGLFERTVFCRTVLPKLLALFAVHDFRLRFVLLHALPHFQHVLSAAQVAELLPEIRLGLEDKNDQLVQASLQALSALVTVHGGNVMGVERHAMFGNFGERRASQLMSPGTADVFVPPLPLR